MQDTDSCGSGRSSPDAIVGAAARSVDSLVAAARLRLTVAADRMAAESTTEIRPREALLLLGDVLGWNEAQVRARGDRLVEEHDAARFEELVDRRCSGEPVAYLTGHREFFGRVFQVDDRVLIPRPETEHLVEVALERIRRRQIEQPVILDVGTGSGCIAVTLACELPAAELVATDISLAALNVAKSNSRRLGVEHRTRFVASDLVSACRLGGVDLLVSNPPYVSAHASGEMSPEVLGFEPHLALFAEDHGRHLIASLLDAASGLRPGTDIVLEIGFDQGGWIEQAVRSRAHLRWDELVLDYAGHPRTAICRRV